MLLKELATHSSVLAWRIPGTGEPGGLPSVGSHRVRHDWSDLAAAALRYVFIKYHLSTDSLIYSVSLFLFLCSLKCWYLYIQMCQLLTYWFMWKQVQGTFSAGDTLSGVPSHIGIQLIFQHQYVVTHTKCCQLKMFTWALVYWNFWGVMLCPCDWSQLLWLYPTPPKAPPSPSPQQKQVFTLNHKS